MITKMIKLITAGLMLAAFFCAQAFAYDLPQPVDERVEGASSTAEPIDKNYVYIGRYNGLDYFLDKFSLEIKKDNGSARSWTQYIFPIGEKVPPSASRSTVQKFFTDGESAYNSLHRRNPLDRIENEKNAFGTE